jgi:hypothetical protein
MYESKEDIIKLKLEIEELKNKNQLLEEKCLKKFIIYIKNFVFYIKLTN